MLPRRTGSANRSGSIETTPATASSPRPIPIDRDFTLSTLRELIRIDSRNPALEPDAPGELELARVVAALLGDLHWDAKVHELGNRRANVTALRRGRGGGPSLLINVHLDTVGVAGMQEPFGGDRRGGRLYGRGAQDTKGGMAAVLGVARALADAGITLRGDLVLAFVADEEHESLGTADLLRRVRTDAAVVIEPTELDVCTAHRGFGVLRLTTHGRAAHGGRSDLGVDANLHMGRVLAGLDRLRATWERERRHPLLGAAGLHVPRLAGGSGLYVYADRCAADVECRTIPGQSPAEAVREIETILHELRASVADFRGEVEPRLWRPPYEIASDRPIVRAAMAAAQQVRGAPARTIGHGWWEDSGLLGEAGIETVILGPTGAGMHTAEEWVDAHSVVDLAEILYQIILTYCGRA